MIVTLVLRGDVGSLIRVCQVEEMSEIITGIVLH